MTFEGIEPSLRAIWHAQPLNDQKSPSRIGLTSKCKTKVEGSFYEKVKTIFNIKMFPSPQRIQYVNLNKINCLIDKQTDN